MKLPEDMQLFINAINLQSVPIRYPEDFTRLSKELNNKTAAEYIRQTKRIIRWLKKNILQLKLEADQRALTATNF
jgi:HEPN domain-containing protein